MFDRETSEGLFGLSWGCVMSALLLVVVIVGAGIYYAIALPDAADLPIRLSPGQGKRSGLFYWWEADTSDTRSHGRLAGGRYDGHAGSPYASPSSEKGI